jgi:hypothetical protein
MNGFLTIFAMKLATLIVVIDLGNLEFQVVNWDKG